MAQVDQQEITELYEAVESMKDEVQSLHDQLKDQKQKTAKSPKEKETGKAYSRKSEHGDSKLPSYLAMANPEKYEFVQENQDNPYL